jgi:hypothetical protein
MDQSEMGKQQSTMPAARYAAPAGVLNINAPLWRSDLDHIFIDHIFCSIIDHIFDPFEAAVPESGLRSVPF